ncbi:MAG: hypothetical protein SPL12_10860 [Bacteroidales bacterium]|nr:hypothetical protein [Bacteroidales bacterium]
MGVTHVVENPPDGLVALENLVRENTTSDSTTMCLLHRRNLHSGFLRILHLDSARAKVIVEIVIRIVSVIRIIDTIAVSIIERGQIAGQIFTLTTGRPVKDDIRNILLRIRVLDHSGVEIGEVLFQSQNLGLGNNPVLVVGITDGEINGSCTIDLEGTRPEVIALGTETESSDTNLVINVRTTNPQSSTEQRTGVAILRQVILSEVTIIPHVAVAINQGSHIVDVKLGCTLGTLTCSSLGPYDSLFRVGSLAFDTLASRYRPGEGH